MVLNATFQPIKFYEFESHGKLILTLNRPYLTESNKMHPKKLWPKLIFGTVIKPIEFSNISQNQPYLSNRGVQNTPLKIAKNAKKLNMNVMVLRGSNPHLF